jgi:hypothetical protein
MSLPPSADASSILIAPRGQRRWLEHARGIALWSCAAVSLLTTIGIVVFLAYESLQFFAKVSPLEFVAGTTWARHDRLHGRLARCALPVRFEQLPHAPMANHAEKAAIVAEYRQRVVEVPARVDEDGVERRLRREPLDTGMHDRLKRLFRIGLEQFGNVDHSDETMSGIDDVDVIVQMGGLVADEGTGVRYGCRERRREHVRIHDPSG